MKKIFSILFIATMLSMTLMSCGDDEPGKTKAPKINYEIQEEAVIVTAVGDGEVVLYQDGEPTTNPVTVLRSYEDRNITFTATAQEEGKEISEETHLAIEVPFNDNLQVLTVNSAYDNETETHFTFDINLNKELSIIELYNIVFTIGSAQSPAMNIRIDAPVTYDRNTRTYTYAGTGITPYMIRGGSLIPMEGDAYRVTDLTCTVNVKDKTYSISFDCHGGHYENSGKIK
jgi:hypothetical protein